MGILLVGAGVAGAALALALKEAGLPFLWLSEEVGGASRVPVALVNPVRGRRGVLVPEGGEALQAARALYGRYAPLHMGLLRPVPEGEREAWERRLRGSGLRYLWRREGLYLPEAFWLEPGPFLERVWAELGGVRARVAACAPGEVVLEGGRRLRPEVVLYAGGAKGAGVFGLSGRFVAGLELLLAEYREEALSYRVFLAGWALGGSYLDLPGYDEPEPQEGETAWLLEGAEALLGYRPQVAGVWRGVRFRRPAPLSPIPGGYALTGFGSTGFLLAPLWAKRLVQALG
ncbi:FAD-dependent oxidoreductase [Thermus sediminis]|uniref:FAD-dependent oxidoreductase n=1 Tax=Thermus sediminis TaxID=1761908 RepID=UPI000E3E9CFD|nr:FAD-dependent oxidoreductase [Thermus sediminis]